MKAIIIDDEPKAIELIKSYLIHFDSINLIGTFRNSIKAMEFLNQESVDLIFMDINMPHLSGISLSKMISDKTKIVFTTAYSEYAVESYEVNAFDYLLKPIGFERFANTIAKLYNNHLKNNNEDSPIQINLKSGDKIYRVDCSQILYLKKEGNYMMYYFRNQKILTRESINSALKRLPDYFIQSHKSYIVNTRKIDFYNKDEISINNNLIPIGMSFRNKIEKTLGFMRNSSSI
jgi:DNA-binding LytR/AlgR family response regulator